MLIYFTAAWLLKNASECQVTGYDIERVAKYWLYAISKKLYAEKQALEQHLSVRTNELFDIEDKIMLYDLTNTYFEGRKQGSNLAKYGQFRSRFEAGLQKIADSLTKKGGVKQEDKVHQRKENRNCHKMGSKRGCRHQCPKWCLLSAHLCRSHFRTNRMAVLQYHPRG